MFLESTFKSTLINASSNNRVCRWRAPYLTMVNILLLKFYQISTPDRLDDICLIDA